MNFFKGDKVPVTVQLFYIGIGGFLISILCQLVDEDDKFFTPEISEIPLQDIGVALGVGIGMINIKYIEWVVLHSTSYQFFSQ